MNKMHNGVMYATRKAPIMNSCSGCIVGDLYNKDVNEAMDLCNALVMTSDGRCPGVVWTDEQLVGSTKEVLDIKYVAVAEARAGSCDGCAASPNSESLSKMELCRSLRPSGKLLGKCEDVIWIEKPEWKQMAKINPVQPDHPNCRCATVPVEDQVAVVEMFKTVDGELFNTREEAKAHNKRRNCRKVAEEMLARPGNAVDHLADYVETVIDLVASLQTRINELEKSK